MKTSGSNGWAGLSIREGIFTLLFGVFLVGIIAFFGEILFGENIAKNTKIEELECDIALMKEKMDWVQWKN